MEIHKDACFVESTGDGSWTLMEEEGRQELYLPPGITANATAAGHILMIMADAYNRGHRHGTQDGRRDLRRDFHALMNVPATDLCDGGA